MKFVLILKIAILTGCLLAAGNGCSSGDSSAKLQDEWDAMDPVAQEIVCDIYNDPDPSTFDTLSATTPQARLDIMEANC